MSIRQFRKAGHFPTLFSAFLYFDVSFMVWVIFGPLGPFIGEAYHLSAAQKGFLTALPALGGCFFRPVLGWLTERLGGRKTGLAGLAFTLLPLLAAWRWAGSYPEFLAVGLLLGVAGASFAAALPLASAWYPPEYQGLVMGLAGAGNSGTLFATLFGPRIAQAIGWRSVFGLAMIPVAAVWILFFFLAKDAPASRAVKRWSDYRALLRERDPAWFCFLYCLTFGGFLGLTNYLSIFFHDQYGLSKVQSGDFTTVVVFCGSFLRPVGGTVSDRVGGHRMLTMLLAGASVCLLAVATLPAATIALTFLALGMALLGMGNGAVFQLVPQRFAGRVGIMTGIIGAAGGLGGFLLPSLLGMVKQRTGTFGIGFAVLAVVMLSGACLLLYLKGVWRRDWPRAAAQRAGLIPEGWGEDVRAYPANI